MMTMRRTVRASMMALPALLLAILGMTMAGGACGSKAGPEDPALAGPEAKRNH